MNQNISCCFTGHRPSKLPWGADERDLRCVTLKRQLAAALEQAYELGYRHFICGMAQGSDFYFAEAVLALRETHPEITLEGARPCEGQANRWSAEDRQRYEQILNQCDFETLVQHEYDQGCMMRRNRYMVNRSARLIGVYNGVMKGGTAQTILYALRQGLDTDILEIN